MSGPVYGTYPTDDFSRVKRSLQGTPVNLPTAQPGNAGREVGAGGAVKRPKFSPSSRHNSGSNVTIPYPRLFPFKASNPRIGRVDKGDVLFTERPLTTERTLTQNKCGFNSQIGSHSSVLGLDAVNRRLHGSTVDARWVFGVNFCVLKRMHSRTERNNAIRDLKEFQRWSLDGVVLGNDDVQTSRGLDASSDILFNVVVQGPAQVNNGYAMHTVVQGNTSDPGILSHKHPRGSFEAHLSGINTTVNPTTSSVSLNNSKYTGCNTRYPLQMFDRTPKPLDTLYLCARCFKLGDKTSLGEENIDIFGVNGKPHTLGDDEEAYFVQYMPSSMREIDGLHSTLRGMGNATFKDATGPIAPDPTTVPFRNVGGGIPKADESKAWHQWRAKTLAGGYARGLTDVFATILNVNERVRNISFAHDGSVAMSTHLAPKRTKFYTADRDGGDVKVLKPLYTMAMFDERILAISKHVLLVHWKNANRLNRDTVTIFDTNTSASRTVIQFPGGIRASCLDVSADTKTVVGAYNFKVFVKPFNDGLVEFLNTGNGAGGIKKISLPTPTNCVRISLDGQFFVSSDGGSGTTPANVRVWDIARGHEIKRMNNAVSGSITALDITDDGSLVVSGGNQGTVTTWSLLGDDDAYHVLSPVTGGADTVSVFFGRASDNNITVTASVGVNAYESNVYKWTLTLPPPPPNAPYHSYDLDDLKHTVGHYTVGRVMDTQAVRSKNHDVGISESSICVTADVNIRWSLDTIEIGDADSDLSKHLTQKADPALTRAYPVSRFSLKPGRTAQPGGLVISAPSAGDASLDEEIVSGPAATGEATLSAATIGSPALAAVSVATAATAKLPAASPAPVAAPTSSRPPAPTPAPTPAPAPAPAPAPTQTLAPPAATASALAPTLVSSPNPVPTRIPDPAPALARVSTPTAAPRPPRPSAPTPTAAPRPPRPPAPTPTAARAPASNPTPVPAPAPALPPAPVPSPTGAPAPIATRSSTPSTSRGKAQAKSRVQTGGQRPDQAQVASVQTEVAAPAPVQEVPTSTTYRAPTGGASATRSNLSGANTGTSVSKEVDRLFNQLWGS